MEAAVVSQQGIPRSGHKPFQRGESPACSFWTVVTAMDPGGLWLAPIFHESAAVPSLIPSTAELGFLAIRKFGKAYYLTTTGSDGIFVFDGVNRPTQIGTTAGLGFRDMAVIDTTMYLTTHGEDGIWAFDLVNQARPRQLDGTGGLGFRGVCAIDGVLYLTTQGSDGICSFNPSAGQAPSQLGGTAGLGFMGITAARGELYLTTQGSNGVCRYNPKNPTPPVQLPGTAGLGFNCITCFDDNYLLVSTQSGPWGLCVLPIRGDQGWPVAGTYDLGFIGFPDGKDFFPVQQLAMAVQNQQQTNWCWAAVSTSVGNYYQGPGTYSQCQIAEMALGKSGCCANPATCNCVYYLENALDAVHCLKRVIAEPCGLDVLQQQIGGMAPVCNRLQWSGGGAHFVVIAGYEGDIITVEDPWYGTSSWAFDAYPSSYHGVGTTWTHTYFTTAPGVSQ